MKAKIEANGKIKFIQFKNIKIPFTERYGFYIGDSDVMLSYVNDGFYVKKGDVEFCLKYEEFCDYVKILIKIHNKGETDIKEPIGFHTGIDSVMIKYPQWHETYFPTLLRCEKTHLWGYYMNTAQNTLAVATDKGVSSYNIEYNKINEDNYGHRILGSNIVFIQNTDLPERHPDNLKVLKSSEVYENALYFIPAQKEEVVNKLSAIAEIPVITAEKFTLEKGDFLNFEVWYGGKWTSELILPDGRKCGTDNFVFTDYGIYRLIVYCDNGKISEAMFCCRKDWDFYMYNAAREAMNKPQKATTHVESFYGLFSLFLGEKYFDDRPLFDKGYECFEEIMPFMFDFTKFEPVVIPARIQNTALLISMLVDIYEANPEKNLKYLKYAGGFAEYIMSVQDEKGVYRREHIHYTCVIYIAKSILELAMAEKQCGDKNISALYSIHYESVKKAIDELTDNLDNIETEGESTFEDGMISCSALQIAMFALTLPRDKREKYIKAAEYMINIHGCLEQQLIPDCRMNGGSLRYWESQYDVMIRKNMMNSPHGWSAWTGYAYYYLYMLTGKRDYLIRLMNTLGSCVQLMDFDGNLRWGFCSQPYIKASVFVPDEESFIGDGYEYVGVLNKAFRGKYKVIEFGETYIDMISGWYRTGKQKVTGGYDSCPLILKNDVLWDVDRQGGCCDNDVHEIFKCIEECVLRKAFIYENQDGTFLTYGCSVNADGRKINIEFKGKVTELVYNFNNTYEYNQMVVSGFNSIEI